MSQTVTKLHFTPTHVTWRDRAAQFVSSLRAAHRAAHTRQLLATLDDRALSDIGISRSQAQFVAEQPIWDVLR